MDHNDVTAGLTPIGISPPAALAGHVPQASDLRTDVENWFIKPAQSFDSKNGFAILLIVLPLYEAHLRALEIVTKDGFLSDPKSRRQLMIDFGFDDESKAGTFWYVLRNGLLHSLAPNPKATDSCSLQIVLVEAGPAIRVEGSTCYVNACAFREKVVDLVLDRIDEWNSTLIAFSFKVWVAK